MPPFWCYVAELQVWLQPSIAWLLPDGSVSTIIPTILSGEATAALPELSKRLWFLGMRSESDPSCFVQTVIIRKDGGMHAYIYLQIRIYIYTYILFFKRLHVYCMNIYIYATLPGPTIYDKRLMFEGSFLND